MLCRIIITFLMLSVSAIAVADIQLRSYQSGVFQRSDVKLEAGERLVSGSREQIRETDHVLAKLGSKFGIRYSLNGKKASGNRVTYLYLTPGVVEPDGTRHDKYEEVVELQVGVGSHVAAFEFTESWEVVPGSWELLIFSGDHLLVRSKFNVSIEEEDLTPRITPAILD